jgi:hypothetical protein
MISNYLCRFFYDFAIARVPRVRVDEVPEAVFKIRSQDASEGEDVYLLSSLRSAIGGEAVCVFLEHKAVQFSVGREGCQPRTNDFINRYLIQ